MEKMYYVKVAIKFAEGETPEAHHENIISWAHHMLTNGMPSDPYIATAVTTYDSFDNLALDERDAQAKQIIPRWTSYDSKIANAQGWDIFDTGGRIDTRFHLQRIDCPSDIEGNHSKPIFANDEEAAAFVKSMAAGGNPTAKRAIVFLNATASQDVQTFELNYVPYVPTPASRFGPQPPQADSRPEALPESNSTPTKKDE